MCLLVHPNELADYYLSHFAPKINEVHQVALDSQLINRFYLSSFFKNVFMEIATAKAEATTRT